MKFPTIISFFLLSVCAFSQQASHQQLSKKMDSIFSNYHQKPGIAVAIVKEGKTVFKKGYGLSNVSHDIPITSKTIFNVGAISKQFTAACIFLLEQEGRLNLDDPIQKHLPDFPSYSKTPITIKNLLYDTSGLREYLSTLHSKNKYFGDRFNQEDFMQLMTNHQGLNFPTGSKHSWGYTNYVLLANIVKVASGTSLGRYAKEKIFNPLGMSHTFFKEEQGIVVKNMATGYQAQESLFKELNYTNHIVVGPLGLHTNVDDLVLWSSNFTSGTVGGEELIKKLTTPGRLKNGKDIIYAGGLFYQNHYDIEGLPRVAHSGNWGGFQSLFYKFLHQDVTIIILSNRADTFVWGVLDQVTPFVLGPEIDQARQAMRSQSSNNVKPISLSKAQKEKYIGKYYSTLNGYLRQIVLKGDTLVYKLPGGHSRTLVAISKNELIYENAPQVKFTFKSNRSDSMTLTINDRNPVTYQKYEEHVYTSSELKQFEHKYYSKDIDEIFQIASLKGALQVLVQGKEVFRLQPIAKDLFTSAHSGYIIFDRNENSTITGFTRYDDTLYNLKHTVIHTNR